MTLLKELNKRIYERIKKDPHNPDSLISFNEALDLYKEDYEELVSLAEIVRKFYHQNYVLVHVINNIRNGNCGEDCGYCAQRKSASGIPTYSLKSEEEILKEAEEAKRNGAYRYCLVTAGRGINPKMAQFYANIIKRIIEEIGIKVCLSAGIVEDPTSAKILAEAGLDRYNHNLNTSRRHYPNIATTHTYEDREKTLKNISQSSIGLCSGVIVGMGETLEDRIEVGLKLNEFRVESIPVNFFLPVPGHQIQNYETFTPEECLKILSLYRLMNPQAELRIAAGRELYLKEKQPIGLRVANSLFVSGYLNVRGSSAYETIKMIYLNGFQLDPKTETTIQALKDQILKEMDSQEKEQMLIYRKEMELKTLKELRPYFDHAKN
ncbi:MAG: biotin synthase BioB [Leptospiraceae bacterium]|nr:biotin synthase BioB [Leptospiraceae bacterium]MDW7976269.1 biotin synthase BioB [Leptospiraceae bacterium]